MAENDFIKNDLIEINPEYLESFAVPKSYKKFSWEIFPALGTAFDSFAATFQNVVCGEGGSGLYRVDVPNNGKLFKFKDGSGFTGNAIAENGGVGGGQARLNPIQVDVGQLCNAVTLASIQLKLSDIQEQEKSIYDYLKVKDRSTMLGYIEFLTDTLQSYKQNWNNEDYKNSRRNKIVSILADSKGYVKQFGEMVEIVAGREKLLHGNKKTEEQLQELMETFAAYRIAIHLFAFSSYMDVLTHNTFAEDYLTEISKKINNCIANYQIKYTECYNKLEKYANSTIEGYLIKGLSRAQFAFGKAAGNVPLMNKAPVDAKLKEGVAFIEEINKDRIDDVMKSFVQCKMQGENIFVNQINTINMLHNRPVVVLFDKENFYIGDGTEVTA